MPSQRVQIYADLPVELHDADELLERYGRHLRGGRGAGRCGSAEGMYRAPQDDTDRQPRPVQLTAIEAEDCRKSLEPLPTVTRTILLWLYAPGGESVQARMRRCRVRPVDMRERHLQGVREFWNHWQTLQRARGLARQPAFM